MLSIRTNGPSLGVYVGNSIIPSSHNSLVIFFPCGCLLCMLLWAAFLLCPSGTSLVLHAPHHNLQSLCQDLTSCYSFLLLVFDLMLLVLDNCTSRVNGKVWTQYLGQKGRWSIEKVKVVSSTVLVV